MNFARFSNENGPENVKPLGWQHVPGGDWEIYLDTTPLKANLYHEDLLMEAVTADTRKELTRKVREANAKHGIEGMPR